MLKVLSRTRNTKLSFVAVDGCESTSLEMLCVRLSVTFRGVRKRKKIESSLIH